MPEYRYGSRARGAQKRVRKRSPAANRVLAVLALVLLTAGIGFGIYKGIGFVRKWVHDVMEDDPAPTSWDIEGTTAAESDAEPVDYSVLIDAAFARAEQYDYDGAIAMIKQVDGYDKDAKLADALYRLQTARAELVKVDVNRVCHLSMRSLIADTTQAFSSSSAEKLNANYVTLSEFEDILKELYAGGYVLVRLHDLAHTDENGYFVSGSVLLPKDKKALVLSVEDLVYYEANTALGFASRLILDEEGNPKCELRRRDGTVAVGSFDIVPMLEDFLKKHPDFSYKGARGVIALTGYDGILGYRTAPKYGDPQSSDYKPYYSTIKVDEERTEATRTASRLKELGWEFASHSWGHINMANASLDRIREDTEKWLEQVGSLIGGADILFFDNGADIGNWRNYSADNEKYAYLKSVGFNYFCGVDLTTIPWVQLSTTAGYLRQGRVTVNGTQLIQFPARLEPFFKADEVLDPARP